MDSNYQWQKHQAKERSQARMREADVHRMLKDSSPRREFILIRGLKSLFRGISSSSQERKRISRETKRARKPRLAK